MLLVQNGRRRLEARAKHAKSINNNLRKIRDAGEFIKSVVPSREDVDIVDYVKLVIIIVQRYKDRLSTEDEQRDLSLAHLLLSMFEGHRNVCETRYIDVMNLNAAKNSTIEEAVERIYSIFGNENMIIGGTSNTHSVYSIA